MATCIIIDDMELARATLKQDIEDHCPDLSIIGEAESVVSGIKLLKKITPDILFLDIQLQDGEGFDILEILSDLKSKVIFTTASDAHAIKAFQFSAVDYLLKPIDPELLVKAVKKSQKEVGDHGLKLSLLKEQYTSKGVNQKIALHTADKILVANLEDIVRLESMGNYTQFFFEDKTKLLVTKTLKEFDNMLTEQNFIRVHQSHLINMDHIHAYVKTEGGYILMHDKTIVPVSVRKKPFVVEMLSRYNKI